MDAGRIIVRKIAEEQEAAVENFYDEKKQIGQDDRRQLPFYNYRCFQNWIKSVLINEAVRYAKEGTGASEISVLDLGCGKGGDLKKFMSNDVANYVGVDVALGQLRDALRRKLESRFQFPTCFIKENGAAPPEQFLSKLEPNEQFNLVSAQFCIHYFFANETSVRNFLGNISARLARGGIFCATFPDSKVIAKNIETRLGSGDDPVVFENSFYSVIMSREEMDKPDFGIRYGFFLDGDLIGSRKETPSRVTIEYVPEFLVLMEPFLRIAAEYGFELVINQNFHKFYAEQVRKQEYFNLLRKMRFNETEDGPLISEDGWLTSYLYCVLILRKTTGPHFDNTRQYRHPSYFNLKY